MHDRGDWLPKPANFKGGSLMVFLRQCIHYVSKKRVDPDLNNFKTRLPCCGTKGLCP